MTRPLVIFGAAEQAEVAWFYFTNDAASTVRAFAVDADHLKSSSFCGLPVVSFENVAKEFPPQEYDFFVAIGYSKLNALREERYLQAKKLGYRLRSYISSKATTWPGLSVGENCLVLEDNTIQPFVRIADNVTLWSGNHIGHHARIGKNVFITSHVVVSGAVEVGDNSFLGVNSTLRDHIRIGRFAIVGAGALVTADVPDYGVIAASGTELSKVPSNRLRKI